MVLWFLRQEWCFSFVLEKITFHPHHHQPEHKHEQKMDGQLSIIIYSQQHPQHPLEVRWTYVRYIVDRRQIKKNNFICDALTLNGVFLLLHGSHLDACFEASLLFCNVIRVKNTALCTAVAFVLLVGRRDTISPCLHAPTAEQRTKFTHCRQGDDGLRP